MASIQHALKTLDRQWQEDNFVCLQQTAYKSIFGKAAINSYLYNTPAVSRLAVAWGKT